LGNRTKNTFFEHLKFRFDGQISKPVAGQSSPTNEAVETKYSFGHLSPWIDLIPSQPVDVLRHLLGQIATLSERSLSIVAER
jgi:hypothetical protein